MGYDMWIEVIARTFSPKKLRISRAAPFSWMIQLIGKCAYTALILYWKP